MHAEHEQFSTQTESESSFPDVLNNPSHFAFFDFHFDSVEKQTIKGLTAFLWDVS